MRNFADIQTLENAFASIAACPNCRVKLAHAGDQFVCPTCKCLYPQRDGIWRFLRPDQEQHYQAFLDHYPTIRRGDGWEDRDDEYYLGLPKVPVGDPFAMIWRVREQTLGIMLNTLSYVSWRTRLDPRKTWVLDLGAGNCWLSHRLAQAGYRVLAVDLNAEGGGGLSGGKVYLTKGKGVFVRGQASMDKLPVLDNQIAFCVISGACHFADLKTTFASVHRVLKRGASLFIMDSPTYENASDGETMMARQRERYRAQHNLDGISIQGKGYLLLWDTLAAMERAGFLTMLKWRWTERPGVRWLRRFLKPNHRDEARYPLFIGIKR
jgi:SAM-dependent methyltransferase